MEATAAVNSLIRICNNKEDVAVTGNASNGGTGAIHTAGALYVCNNSGKVVFGNNSVYDENTKAVVLNSINALRADFAAAAGGSIELRDAVSIRTDLRLNADAEGAAQTGEITFSGRYTDAYLSMHQGDVSDKAASRFSVVEGSVLLHGDRLTEEAQAVLQPDSFSVLSGKGAVVSLASGGELRVAGEVVIGQDTTLAAEHAPDIGTLQLTDMASVPSSIDELMADTAVAGVLQCSRLTLASGSIYTLNGGILDLAGAALCSADVENLTISSSNQAAQIGDDQVLLLFCGVAACESAGAVLTYMGKRYTEENIVFDATRNVVYLSGIVPEPSTAALSLAACIALLMRRRRPV